MTYNQSAGPSNVDNLFGFQWVDEAGIYGLTGSNVQSEVVIEWNCFQGGTYPQSNTLFFNRAMNNTACGGNPSIITSTNTCQCSPVVTPSSYMSDSCKATTYYTNGRPNQYLYSLYSAYPLVPDAGTSGIGLSVNLDPNQSQWLNSYGIVTVTY